MNAVIIDRANKKFAKPENWVAERNGVCHTLEVRVGEEFPGFYTISSAWMPTKEELALLNAGRPVTLVILGEGMPPVMLLVE